MDKESLISINDLSVQELTCLEYTKISGGGEGTFADEIGYFFGYLWRGVVTSHRARAEGQLLAYK